MDCDLAIVCGFCHGEMYNIGKLGSTQWFRCRACGLERRLDDDELNRFEAFLEVSRDARENAE